MVYDPLINPTPFIVCPLNTLLFSTKCKNYLLPRKFNTFKTNTKKILFSFLNWFFFRGIPFKYYLSLTCIERHRGRLSINLRNVFLMALPLT